MNFYLMNINILTTNDPRSFIFGMHISLESFSRQRSPYAEDMQVRHDMQPRRNCELSGWRRSFPARSAVTPTQVHLGRIASSSAQDDVSTLLHFPWLNDEVFPTLRESEYSFRWPDVVFPTVQYLRRGPASQTRHAVQL